MIRFSIAGSYRKRRHVVSDGGDANHQNAGRGNTTVCGYSGLPSDASEYTRRSFVVVLAEEADAVRSEINSDDITGEQRAPSSNVVQRRSVLNRVR